jgi:hypothetical protein
VLRGCREELAEEWGLYEGWCIVVAAGEVGEGWLRMLSSIGGGRMGWLCERQELVGALDGCGGIGGSFSYMVGGYVGDAFLGVPRMSFFIENFLDRPFPDVGAGWSSDELAGGVGVGSCGGSPPPSVSRPPGRSPDNGGSSWFLFLTIRHTGNSSLRNRAIAS